MQPDPGLPKESRLVQTRTERIITDTVSSKFETHIEPMKLEVSILSFPRKMNQKIIDRPLHWHAFVDHYNCSEVVFVGQKEVGCENLVEVQRSALL